jgi:hypothetical protein
MFDIAVLSNFRLTVKFESVHCEVLKGVLLSVHRHF